MYPREIKEELKTLAGQYPVITLSGPRQAGKTTLARSTFPEYAYVSLEDPDIRDLAEKDPRSFFRLYSKYVIIDEVQRVPMLPSYIQRIVDESQAKAHFILTGNHQLELNQAITQSLAGRSALLHLMPLSIKELASKTPADQIMHQGFMPAVHKDQMDPTRYYRNYFQTYVERDVRLMVHLKDFTLFQTFIRLCAGRVGQLLNVNSLANEVGVQSNTINHWLSILEASFIVFRLQPYYENLGKRLVKTPKLYFTEIGLACYLLGIETPEQLARDPLRGSLFENMVVVELVKARLNQGLDPNLYFYRDSNANEVDVIFKKGRDLIPIEIKSAETFSEGFLKSVSYFNKIIAKPNNPGALIYNGTLCPETNNTKVLNFRDSPKSLKL